MVVVALTSGLVFSFFEVVVRVGSGNRKTLRVWTPHIARRLGATKNGSLFSFQDYFWLLQLVSLVWENKSEKKS